MPTTVTASNGNVYHLWQLPDLATPEPEDRKRHTTLDNDLSDAYRSTRLFGASTGVRSWNLTLPTLSGSTIPAPTVTGVDGAAVSREEYIRTLYDYNKLEGKPFVYQHNGQNYLVDFADEELSMQRLRVKIYSSGIELRQRRLLGVTVFDPTAMLRELNVGVASVENGDVLNTTQNGLTAKRLNSVAGDGTITGIAGDFDTTIYDIFIVMKVREAAFSNWAGIIGPETGANDTRILLGHNGNTRFTNLLHTNYEYRLNGRVYDVEDQQAPMNEWGVVHLRFLSGKTLVNYQIGKDRTEAASYAKIDVGEFQFGNGGGLLPMTEVREYVESLSVKWGIRQ